MINRPADDCTCHPVIAPGAGGTIPSQELSTFRMGNGAGKPLTVILDGRVMRYVGIGWVDEKPATQEDADTSPVVTYPDEDDRPHLARF